jgi:hypothetical protein
MYAFLCRLTRTSLPQSTTSGGQSPFSFVGRADWQGVEGGGGGTQWQSVVATVSIVPIEMSRQCELHSIRPESFWVVSSHCQDGGRGLTSNGTPSSRRAARELHFIYATCIHLHSSSMKQRLCTPRPQGSMRVLSELIVGFLPLLHALQWDGQPLTLLAKVACTTCRYASPRPWGGEIKPGNSVAIRPQGSWLVPCLLLWISQGMICY